MHRRRYQRLVQSWTGRVRQTPGARDGQRTVDRLARLPRPTAAALQGDAFGGGLEPAAVCDIRTMAPDATLALPETRSGIVPGWSGTRRLARLMPEPLVREMALFAYRITADWALACGFVAAVDREPRAMAEKFLQRAVALSPRAVETANSMIHAAQGEDRGTMIEMLGSAAVFASPDRKEGVAAFLEKREAWFRGERCMASLRIVADRTDEWPAAPCPAHHAVDGTLTECADGRKPDRISPSHGVHASPAPAGSEAGTEAASKAARMVFDGGRRSRFSGRAHAEDLHESEGLIEPGRFTTSGSELSLCTSITLKHVQESSCVATSEPVLAGASTSDFRASVSSASRRGSIARSPLVSDRKRSRIPTAQTAIQSAP